MGRCVVATKAELEEQLAEAQAQLADRAEEQVSEPEEVELTPSGDVTKETILAELRQFDRREVDSTYMEDVYGHRLDEDAFVRAFAWARKRGNELKACLIYADAHDGDFEASNEPVVKRD